MSKYQPHELQEFHAERLSEDELYSALDEAAGQVLWDLPLEETAFDEEIARHIEAACDHLDQAMRLRSAEVSDELITNLEGETDA